MGIGAGARGIASRTAVAIGAEGVKRKAGAQVHEAEEGEGALAARPARRWPAGPQGGPPGGRRWGQQEPGCAGSLGVSGAQDLLWERSESPGQQRQGSPVLCTQGLVGISGEKPAPGSWNFPPGAWER